MNSQGPFNGNNTFLQANPNIQTMTGWANPQTNNQATNGFFNGNQMFPQTNPTFNLSPFRVTNSQTNNQVTNGLFNGNQLFPQTNLNIQTMTGWTNSQTNNQATNGSYLFYQATLLNQQANHQIEIEYSDEMETEIYPEPINVEELGNDPINIESLGF